MFSPANGLGMVLAEKGTLDHAKDVFARVREVSAEVLGDVWINLAHVYLAQNKHNEVTVLCRPVIVQGKKMWIFSLRTSVFCVHCTFVRAFSVQNSTYKR